MTGKRIDDEILMAFLDGELPPEEMTAIAEAIDADPDLAALAASLDRASEVARAAFARGLEDPVPDALVAAARRAEGALNRETTARAAPGGLGSWLGTWRPRAVALAGAAAAFVAITVFVGGRPTLVPPDRAAAALPEACSAEGVERVLERASSGTVREIAAGCRIAPLATFAAAGGYCRQFQVAAPDVYRGLACRQAGGWSITDLARDGPGAGFAPATGGSALGEALDPVAEAALIEANWQSN